MELDKRTEDDKLPKEVEELQNDLSITPPEGRMEAEDSPQDVDEEMTAVRIPEAGKFLSLRDFPLVKKRISHTQAAGLRLVANVLALADPTFSLPSMVREIFLILFHQFGNFFFFFFSSEFFFLTSTLELFLFFDCFVFFFGCFSPSLTSINLPILPTVSPGR